MSSGHVLVIGCAAGPASPFGIEADSRAITSQQVSVAAVATANATRRNGESYQTVQTTPEGLHAELEKAISQSDLDPTNCNVVKIANNGQLNSAYTGAILDPIAIRVIADMLPSMQRTVVLDMERWFHTDMDPSRDDALAAFCSHILPHTSVLCATVDDALSLLEHAGAPVPPPRGIPDIKLIGITLRHLGPTYVVIKQEFVDEGEGVTSLQYVLCGPQEEPAYDRLRCKNPNAVAGASYSAASAIAAHLAKGVDAPEAVPAAFTHIQKTMTR
ncbi:hypothetical protein NLG97_g9180 [Lecanicillium saksenae]|uniref:Uncharacterized protein n=1 Tax=Lecanicillium saksenae TaxID=468837 RepID=A0ACC1QK38_9HYPO|nr:hypothetical protein NLG97_g9180 [Lecanicillium saksenae]